MTHDLRVAEDVGRLRALILCGGLGTRLRSAVAEVPKVLAPVAGRPFLDVLVAEIRRAGLHRLVLLAGHLADQVERYAGGPLRRAYPDVELALSAEPAPLGTAGAVKHAARFIDGTFLLVNGDTFLELDAAALLAAHRAAGALVTLAAVPVPDTSRYGALDVAPDGALRSFTEKATAAGPGLINAGAYLAEPRLLDEIPAGRAASLEREILPALLARGERLQTHRQAGRFVDIGTPESWAAFSRYLADLERGPSP